MRVESHGGMILTGENQSTWRRTCLNATLYTTNPTWIEPGLCSEWCGLVKSYINGGVLMGQTVSHFSFPGFIHSVIYGVCVFFTTTLLHSGKVTLAVYEMKLRG
jgi:hypothetical protein